MVSRSTKFTGHESPEVVGKNYSVEFFREKFMYFVMQREVDVRYSSNLSITYTQIHYGTPNAINRAR